MRLGPRAERAIPSTFAAAGISTSCGSDQIADRTGNPVGKEKQEKKLDQHGRCVV